MDGKINNKVPYTLNLVKLHQQTNFANVDLVISLKKIMLA